MIGTPEIAQIIAQPNLVNESHIEDLSGLCEKHPFAQIFPILLLKGLSNTKSTSFEQELTNHSYKISNRAQLFELITSFEEQSVPAEESIGTQPAETSLEEDTQSQEEPIQTISEPISEQKITDEVEETTTNEIIEQEDQVTEEVEEVEEVEETVPEKEDGEPKDALEESILHSALISNYALDDLTEEEEKNLQEKESSESVEAPMNEVQEEFEPIAETEEPASFISWLHADKNYQEEDNTEKLAIDNVVNDFKDFDPLSTLSGEVEKPKTEFFSPTKKAKESLDESAVPVSETLAKIYYLQGNYPKAIEAYKQLSLKFPEKKIFFANLIKDLEKNLKT